MSVTLNKISHQYKLDETTHVALQAIDLKINAGELICLKGASGSGKTTLLNIIGLIESVQAGSYEFFGQDIASLSEGQKNAIRRQDIGFVFQFFHLFPFLTARENVEFFLAKVKKNKKEIKDGAEAALCAVGMQDHLDKVSTKLSGGQRQRVAIARAVAKCPRLIVADEPTASLDRKNGEQVMTIFRELNEKSGTTIVVASHDEMTHALIPKKVVLEDGKICG